MSESTRREPIIAGGMVCGDVAIRKSHGGWIVTPQWCADLFWRIVLSNHATKEEADAEVARLESTRGSDV